MRTSEILSIAFGAYVAAVALRPRWGWRRRTTVWICGALMAGIPRALAAAPPTPAATIVRDWAPAIYILISYYASGALFVGPSLRFESWLAAMDARLHLTWDFARVPAWLTAVLELLYAGTFVVIPAGFAVLVAVGMSAAADRYWTMVSLSEYVAFGLLPWLPSRPPWQVENLTADSATGMRRLGLTWVRRTSHGANTFPSGHTAGSLTIALAVIPFAPVPGLVLLAVALGIAVGCVAGRYHYAVDVVAGVALAVAVRVIFG